jgi:hypothetical protein
VEQQRGDGVGDRRAGRLEDAVTADLGAGDVEVVPEVRHVARADLEKENALARRQVVRLRRFAHLVLVRLLAAVARAYRQDADRTVAGALEELSGGRVHIDAVHPQLGRAKHA